MRKVLLLSGAVLLMCIITTHNFSPRNLDIVLATNDSPTLLSTNNRYYDNISVGMSKDLMLKNNLVNRQGMARLDTSEGWMAQIDREIKEMEYHISFDSSMNAYQCPNRRNNIRAYFEPGVFTMKNRVDSVGHNWTVKLINKGIYADNNLVALPEKEATLLCNKNEMTIQHCSFEEQYINSIEGVRQNFIIRSTPQQASELKVKMKVEGLLVEQVHEKELHFYKQVDGCTENVIIYEDLNVWDADNKQLDAHFETTGDEIAIVVDTKEAQYPITIDPIASNTVDKTLSMPNGKFGKSVSSAGDVNGDGFSDVIVLAPEYDGPNNDYGAVFVFKGYSEGVVSVPSVSIFNGSPTGSALAGDVNGDGFSDIILCYNHYRAAIYYGSPAGIIMSSPANMYNQYVEQVACAGDINNDGFSDVILSGMGRVFIYYGSGNGINAYYGQELQIGETDANYGFSIASAGDVNGDGYSDIIVGAPTSGVQWPSNNRMKGKVFIYRGSATGIHQYAATTTILEGTQRNGQFGYSVASAGDVNGDGYSDVIIGSRYFEHLHPDSIRDEGAAFVYYGSVYGIMPTGTQLRGSSNVGSEFGCTVASAGDINDDGYADVIVGQYRFNTAYVFYGRDTRISSVAHPLTPDQTAEGFGFSVASAGDVNGDGYSDVIVGAPSSNKAFIYHGKALGIGTVSYANKESDQNDALMGRSVASAGDVNGDGYSEIVVGIPKYDRGQQDEGIIYVIYYNNGITNPSYGLIEVNQAGAQFGHSVASAGDVNGDGFFDVIVGAPLYTNGQSEEGATFIFNGSAGGLSTVFSRKLESHMAGAKLGWSVASAGDVNGDGFSDIIIGAPWFQNGQVGEGAAVIYHGSVSGINSLPANILEINQIQARFGHSVASAGDVNGDGFTDVVIGAPQYSNGQLNEGAVFVYHGSVNGIIDHGGGATAGVPAFIIETNREFSEFGYSVACAGDVNGDGFTDIVVGAPSYVTSPGYQNTSWAFVYYGAVGGINTNPNRPHTPIAKTTSNTNPAAFGCSVASAGDVNGDGYSDIIVGAKYHMNNGGAFIYHGSKTGINDSPSSAFSGSNYMSQFGYSVASAGDINRDGYSDVVVGEPGFNQNNPGEGRIGIYIGNTILSCRRNNMQLYNMNLNTVINQTSITSGLFGTSSYARSFLGRNKGKIVWESVECGQKFSGGTITNSTLYTSQQNFYTDLGTNGIELKSLIQPNVLASKVRVRVKYNPSKAITGQIYGPWRYMPGFISGLYVHNNLPKHQGLINNGGGGQNLREVFSDEEALITQNRIKVYPNPVSQICKVEAVDGVTLPQQIEIYNVRGQQVKTVTLNLEQTNVEIDFSDIPEGTYLLMTTDKKLLSKVVKQ